MTTLWDTTGTEVVKSLGEARRSAGMISGLALTLVVVADEKKVPEAEIAATRAAAAHPCRVLIVVRRQLESPQPRLDAEISVGGRLGPGEAVVMRMYGRLALHAESVTLPLLAPDVPVVTWWHGEPPEKIAYDPLGVFADRRVTDSAQATDPIAALHARAQDYRAGDTDLAWTRATPWRALLAGAYDTVASHAASARVAAEAGNPSALLICGWLQNRLGVVPEQVSTSGPGITEVHLKLVDDTELSVTRHDGRTAVLRRTGVEDRMLPLHRREVGEPLAEELRRLDPDQPYAAALGAATGVAGLDQRPRTRVHEWRDPIPTG
jgi:glucose-6-phosphate dehydrogenase assembly protein OpcA